MENTIDLLQILFPKHKNIMQYCHARGVSHWDLKPEILLFDENVTKIQRKDVGKLAKNENLPPNNLKWIENYSYEGDGIISRTKLKLVSIFASEPMIECLATYSTKGSVLIILFCYRKDTKYSSFRKNVKDVLFIFVHLSGPLQLKSSQPKLIFYYNMKILLRCLPDKVQQGIFNFTSPHSILISVDGDVDSSKHFIQQKTLRLNERNNKNQSNVPSLLVLSTKGHGYDGGDSVLETVCQETDSRQQSCQVISNSMSVNQPRPSDELVNHMDDTTQRTVEKMPVCEEGSDVCTKTNEIELSKHKNTTTDGKIIDIQLHYALKKPDNHPLSHADISGINLKEKENTISRLLSPMRQISFHVIITAFPVAKLKRLSYELLRVQSFAMSEIPTGPGILEIASAGFYSSGERGEVTCFSCGKRHYNFLAGIDFINAHKPHCRRQEENKLLMSLPEDLREILSCDNSNTSPPSGRGYVTTDGASRFDPDQSDLTHAIASQGSTITPDISVPRIVQEELPDSAHKILTSATTSEPYDFGMRQSSGLQPSSSLGNADEGRTGRGYVIQNWDLSGASYPQFASLEARRETFQFWDPSHSQKPDELIHLGFFFSGYSDCARCFYCGLGLKYWRPTDGAAYQHARFRPHCLYNRLVKGQAFIDRVQQEINEQANATRAATVADSETLMNTSAAIEATRNGWLREDVIKAIRRMLRGAQADTDRITYAVLLPVLERMRQDNPPGGNDSRTSALALGPASNDTAGPDFARAATNVKDDESSVLNSAAAKDAIKNGWPRADVVQMIRNLVLGSASHIKDLTYSELLPSLKSMKAQKLGPSSSDASIVADYGRMSTSSDTSTVADFGRMSTSSDTSTVADFGRMSTSSDTSVVADYGRMSTSSNTSTVADFGRMSTSSDGADIGKTEPLDDVERIRLAEEEHAKLKNKMYCMSCKVSRIGCVFLPCGHVVACQECGERASVCCLCNKHIIALANIYLS